MIEQLTDKNRGTNVRALSSSNIANIDLYNAIRFSKGT